MVEIDITDSLRAYVGDSARRLRWRGPFAAGDHLFTPSLTYEPFSTTTTAIRKSRGLGGLDMG
jgi:hypothetical protein